MTKKTVATTVHNENLGEEIYSMASVPGRVELTMGRPLAGQAGNCHDRAIAQMSYAGQTLKRGVNISIVNSWPTPIFMKQDGRTEASLSEISQQWNLERLNEEISENCKVVIAWGKNAIYAANLVKTTFKRTFEIVEAEHPSFSNLNRNYKSNESSAQKRSADRIRQLADKIKANSNGILN